MNQQFTSFSDFKRRYPIRPNDEAMLLGSGSYGKVVKVEDQLETEWVAIKISEVKGTDGKSLLDEVKLAQGIPRQANIARYDACYRLETDTSLSDFAVMKYYKDGNLAVLLRNERLSSTQIYDLTKGILLGLLHLHSHRIVHRDFKPANILISRDNEGKLIPKIADFGLSKLVGHEEIDNSDFDLSDGRGTPSYKAPEQIEGSRVSFNLDLWAFGVILYEIMVGEKPFHADMRSGSEQAVRRAVELKIMAVQLPTRINQIAEPYQRIIKRCLVRDIHQRARKVSELLDLLDNIPQLLADAQAAEEGGDYEQARTNYEQVLRFSPSNAIAIRGLATCIDKSRPPVSMPVEEPTDAYKPTVAYHDELPTDVFVASPPLPVQTEAALGQSVGQERLILPPSTTLQPRPGTLLPWRYIVPVAIVVVGVGLYTVLAGKKTAPPVNQPPTDTLAIESPSGTGGVGPTGGTKTGTLLINSVTLVRVIAAMKAKGATAEARQLQKSVDRAKTGTLAQQKATLQQLKQAELRYVTAKATTPIATSVGATASPAPPVAVVTPPSADPKPVETKPTETKPTAPEPDAATAKLDAQRTYDQLIEKGTAAISNGNNKAAAMGYFTEARQLADKQDLNPEKGRVRYSQYMEKAKRILESDDYDAAKKWYEVAQSINNTTEVKSRIKQCISQIN